jgi:pyruvate/2-oxoglutarate dehydrogenase complex dihydrolipoamide dehydrogenase (E3) component
MEADAILMAIGRTPEDGRVSAWKNVGVDLAANGAIKVMTMRSRRACRRSMPWATSSTGSR